MKRFSFLRSLYLGIPIKKTSGSGFLLDVRHNDITSGGDKSAQSLWVESGFVFSAVLIVGKAKKRCATDHLPCQKCVTQSEGLILAGTM